MARFVKHTSCDKCGSSDAKAIYDDGSSFCFSCKSATNGSVIARIKGNQPLEQNNRGLPSDCCSHFTGSSLEWLTRYGFSIEDLLKHGVRYSPKYNQVVYTWPNTDVWQARSISPKKLFTSGNHDNVLLLYYSKPGVTRCVLTEDPLSGIKIASAGPFSGLWSDAMPLLGTHLPSAKLRGLKRLYSRVDVFLDHDKFKDASRLSSRLKLLGLESHAYLHELDPKEIPYEELAKILSVAY